MSWARCFAFTLASVCYSMSAIVQNTTSPGTTENNESKPIEQITVIGKKPFLTLFNQLEAAKLASIPNITNTIVLKNTMWSAENLIGHILVSKSKFAGRNSRRTKWLEISRIPFKVSQE